MQVTLAIPEKLFQQDGSLIARELLEGAGLAAYRAELISIGRLAEILGFSLDEAHGFLKAHEVPLNLSYEEIEQGAETLAALCANR